MPNEMKFPKMSLWFVVNAFCVLATLTQLVFIIASFINPNELNTVTSELALEDIDFPLDIKICAEPAFNESAITAAGYGDEWPYYEYFTGRSRYNRSIFGWAGHTPDLGIIGSVEGVLDMVRNHKVDDIFEKIEFEFRSRRTRSLNIPAQLNKVNYPQNCYTLNLTHIIKAGKDALNTLMIDFKTNKTQKVIIKLQGRTLISNREIFDNTFYTRGDQIIVHAGRFHKYAVEISKNVYLEEDKSKNCRNYPNAEFASYMECDEQHMKNICESMYLAPIWLYDDFKQVTKMAIVNDPGRFI